MAENSSSTNLDAPLSMDLGSGTPAFIIESQSVEIQDAIRTATSMTNSIYASALTITEKDDPEIPDDHYFAFRVTDSGTMDEMLARYNQWHRRLSELPQHLRGMFRLSINVRP